jgi:hypothetical protein
VRPVPVLHQERLALRDPHVEKLHYRIVPGEGVDFDNAVPLACDAHDFELELAGGKLTARPVDHFATGEEARAKLDDRLRAWEISHALTAGRLEIRFQFERAEIIDRDPPSPGQTGVVGASLTLSGAVATSGARALIATGHTSHVAFPPPPTDFAVDPDVETLWHRLEGYRAGREPLQSMAYFCLTVVEWRAGPRRGNKRRRAARLLGIDFPVLNTVGRLTWETGDERTTARKHNPNLRPIQPAEKAWLEAAVTAFVRRFGEHAADSSSLRPEITMSDLPPL